MVILLLEYKQCIAGADIKYISQAQPNLELMPIRQQRILIVPTTINCVVPELTQTITLKLTKSQTIGQSANNLLACMRIDYEAF